MPQIARIDAPFCVRHIIFRFVNGENRFDQVPDARREVLRRLGVTLVKADWIFLERGRTEFHDFVLSRINVRKKGPDKGVYIRVGSSNRHADAILIADLSWSAPLPAIREALINSVVHADYSQSGAPIRISIFDDRIEFENPGLLPFFS